MNTQPSKSNKERPEAESDALASEIAALRKDLQALVERVGTVGTAARSEAVSVARDTAGRGLDAGGEIVGGLLDDWRKVDRKVVAATRTDPWRTLGLAALIGLMLGLILRR